MGKRKKFKKDDADPNSSGDLSLNRVVSESSSSVQSDSLDEDSEGLQRKTICGDKTKVCSLMHDAEIGVGNVDDNIGKNVASGVNLTRSVTESSNLPCSSALPSNSISDINVPLSANMESSDMLNLITNDSLKLFIQSATDLKLASMNPIAIRKAINALAGEVDGIQFLRSGNLFVTAKSVFQRDSLLSCNNLSLPRLSIEIKVSIAVNDQTSQGKIFAPNLKECSSQEILEELRPFNAIKVEKLLKDPKKSQVPLYLITFLSKKCPEFIEVAYCRYKVDLFIPSPPRCSNCCNWGHTRGLCRNQVVCANCSSKGHNASDCKAVSPKCAHCNGEHATFFKECPRVIHENAINRIKFDKNISYPQAKTAFDSKPRNPPFFSISTPVRELDLTDDFRTSCPPIQSRKKSKITSIFDLSESNHSNSNDALNLSYSQATQSGIPLGQQINSVPPNTVNKPAQHSLQLSNDLAFSFSPATADRDHNAMQNEKKEIRQLVSDTIRETLKIILPQCLKLLMSNEITSKIEAVKDICAALDIDQDLDSVIADLGFTSAQSSQ